VLCVLSWVGLVWDLHTPPPHVLNSNRIGAKAVVVGDALPGTSIVQEPVETPAE